MSKSFLQEIQNTTKENHPAILLLKQDIERAANVGKHFIEIPEQSWWNFNADILKPWINKEGFRLDKQNGITTVNW